jgi:hypothetical protein
MSSMKISIAKSLYGGAGDTETLRSMAAKNGYTRIYSYANDFGDKITPTDFKGVRNSAEEAAFLSAPGVHQRVLVFDVVRDA